MLIFDSTAQLTTVPTAVPATVPTAVPAAIPACKAAAVPDAARAAVPAVADAVPVARPAPGPRARPLARPAPVPLARPLARPAPIPLARPLFRLAARSLSALALSAPVLGAAWAAGPVAPSDPAAIEAYRRLPYCRLAPDGLRLANEPCRRPPTRSYTQRRAPPLLPAPARGAHRADGVDGADSAAGGEGAAMPGGPTLPAAQLHAAPPLVTPGALRLKLRRP